MPKKKPKPAKCANCGRTAKESGGKLEPFLPGDERVFCKECLEW